MAIDCDNCYKPLSYCECGDTEVASSDGCTCPWCGTEYTPDGDWWYNDNESTEECGECGKTFTWTGEPTYTWHSKRKLKTTIKEGE